MFAELLQYLFSGLTSGAIYALAGLGFAIIYNSSHVINFAQGEFIMIGGMATASLVAVWKRPSAGARLYKAPFFSTVAARRGLATQPIP